MNNQIRIEAGYRVHINSIDMNGSLRRACGGIGFSLEEPKIKPVIERVTDEDTYSHEVLRNITGVIKRKWGINGKYRIVCTSSLYSHVGLGSETQLNFMIAKGLLGLNNMNVSTYEIAKTLNLANTSGIGYGSFDGGGLIIDLGYPLRPGQKPFAEHSDIPPQVVMNYSAPKNWKVIIIIPNNVKSLSGKIENDFYEKITPVDMKDAQEICYDIFMGILPSMKENKFDNFLYYLSRMSELGTKRYELEINERITTEILNLLKEEFDFAGMSSLGPACYAFFDEHERQVNLRHLSKKFPNCQVFVTNIRNRGVQIYG